MNLKLFEVAGTHIFSMSAIVMVLFFVFAIIVVGYLLGKINIKSRSCRVVIIDGFPVNPTSDDAIKTGKYDTCRLV